MKLNYEQAVRFLENRTNYERSVSIPYRLMGNNLRRLARFIDFLALPRRALVVHLAGTKGKGSVALLLEKILRDQGYRTGLFTSPHLLAWEERFALNGHPCTAGEFAETVSVLKERLAAFEKTDPDAPPFTTFELTFAAALLLFEVKKCDLVVLETGLGGRIDATNVCRPDLTVLTSLGYEHQKQLGQTLAEIAAEKGGIIKPHVPVLSGVGIDLDLLPAESGLERIPGFLRERTVTREAVQEGLGVIRRIAAEKNAPLIELTRVEPEPAAAAEHPIGLAQKRNAQIALSAAEIAERERGVPPRRSEYLASVKDASLPARGEIICRAPVWLIDGAHTRDSAASLAGALSSGRTSRRTLVFAALADKDAAGMLWELLPHFDAVFLTEIPDMPRSRKAGGLLKTARQAALSLPSARVPPIAAEPDLPALLAAMRALPPEETVCFTGSFYLAAKAAAYLREHPRSG